MHSLGLSLLALGVLGLLVLTLDIAVTEVRNWRRERELDDRLSNRPRWDR